MKILAIQPHWDDFIFSCAENALGWIEDGHEITVLTVFGAVPFGAQKEELLHREHHEAMHRLGVPFFQLDFTDDAHVRNYDRRVLIGEAIHDWISGGDWDVTVWPTGIHHPDHGIVAQIGGNFKGRKWVYDELPYLVLYPSLGINPDEDDRPDYYYERLGSRSFLEEKRRLVHCYASQIGETEERCLFAPERVWEVK